MKNIYGSQCKNYFYHMRWDANHITKNIIEITPSNRYCLNIVNFFVHFYNEIVIVKNLIWKEVIKDIC